MASKIVFLGSKPIGYACLTALLTRQQELDLEILAVGSRQRTEFDPEKDPGALARSKGIPLLSSLEELPECDFIISVQHHEILKKRHLQKARKIAINLHLAPLPEYRGCNQFSFAIMNEEQQFGVSLHRMDDRIDHGPVLFESRFRIPDNCWVEELYNLSVEKGLELFKSSLPRLIQGNYMIPARSKQTETPSRLYFRSDIHALQEIDLNSDPHTIEKQIRATSMPGFPAPFCKINGEKISFQREQPDEGINKINPAPGSK